MPLVWKTYKTPMILATSISVVFIGSQNTTVLRFPQRQKSNGVQARRRWRPGNWSFLVESSAGVMWRQGNYAYTSAAPVLHLTDTTSVDVTTTARPQVVLGGTIVKIAGLCWH